jgi:hypothetical protein
MSHCHNGDCDVFDYQKDDEFLHYDAQCDDNDDEDGGAGGEDS